MNTTTSNQPPRDPKHCATEGQADEDDWPSIGEAEIHVCQLPRCIEQNNAAREADKDSGHDPE